MSMLLGWGKESLQAVLGLSVPKCAPCHLTSLSCTLYRPPGRAVGVPKSPTGSGSTGGEAEGGTGRAPPGLDRAACGGWRPAAHRRGGPGAGWMQCESPVLSDGGFSMGGRGFPPSLPSSLLSPASLLRALADLVHLWGSCAVHPLLPAALFIRLPIPSQVIHIFSHIHQTYVVYSLSLDGDVTLDPASSPSRWVTEEEFLASAVSTAMKKVLGPPGAFPPLPQPSWAPGRASGIPPTSVGCPSSRAWLLVSSGLSCASFRS